MCLTRTAMYILNVKCCDKTWEASMRLLASIKRIQVRYVLCGSCAGARSRTVYCMLLCRLKLRAKLGRVWGWWIEHGITCIGCIHWSASGIALNVTTYDLISAACTNTPLCTLSLMKRSCVLWTYITASASVVLFPMCVTWDILNAFWQTIMHFLTQLLLSRFQLICSPVERCVLATKDKVLLFCFEDRWLSLL